MTDENRRNMALFPIRIVMKQTDLTARQIRYYEEHGLIHPERTEGNQRLFTFNDIERLLEIKLLIEKGVNIAGIQQMLSPADDTTGESKVKHVTKTAQTNELAKERNADKAGQQTEPAKVTNVVRIAKSSKTKKGTKTTRAAQLIHSSQKPSEQDLSDDEVHQILRRELFTGQRPGQVSLIQGELSRFYYQQ